MPKRVIRKTPAAKPVTKARKAEPLRLVYCPACDKQQPDLGLRNTCERCGMGPIPSYSYPADSVFHPDRAGRKTKPLFARATTSN